MCGLLGIVSKKDIDKDVADNALNKMDHRGPDAWDSVVEQNVYLGHRRLSIIDLSENGKQPMYSGDGKVSLIFNGEIYNYKGLKEELEKDYEFHSGTDSEVLIYGYKKWGFQSLLERIEGIFAFAIQDNKANKVFVARDRFGIKPIFYSGLFENFIFGSELKSIEGFFSDKQLDIDYTAVYDYLTYTYIPTPKTLYKDVYKLPPASFIEIDTTTLDFEVKKYWELKYEPIAVSKDEAAYEIRKLIDESVQEQLMSDVPLGFFLSGGIDSSIVVATASKYLDKMDTYSIGFTYAPYNETEYAKVVAHTFKTNHTEKILELESVKGTFGKMKDWYDEPFGDTSAFPTNLVSHLASKKSTVVLTGDGGDEVFGGYSRYYRFRDEYNKLSNRVKRLFRSNDQKITDDLETYVKQFKGLTKDDKQEYAEKFNIPEDYDDYWYFRKFYRTDLSLLKRLQYLDIHTYMHDDILTKVDRASMQESIEARVPLLATKLVEYAFNLPESVVYLNGELKGILKFAYEGVLPAEILNKPKKGFSIPFGIWKNEIGGGKKTRQEAVLSLYKDLTL